MADIHYSEKVDMSATDTLYSEIASYVSSIDKVKWKPDYIVIAGDIINANAKYTQADKLINKLINKNAFGISKDRVIVVPGNHDKTLPNEVEEWDNDRQIFEEYCKNVENGDVKFKQTFAERFSSYIKFSKKYNKNTKYATLGGDLSALSGVKVFEEDHLCFVLVNTEWLYVRTDSCVSRVKGTSGKKGDISKHVRVHEDCHLCAPLIKQAYDFIKSNYPTFTVITVMHRGFEYFSWDENNPHDVFSVDSVGYIQRHSDIIITGHDHTIVYDPPTLIKGKTQHFKLGTVGNKVSDSEEFVRFAEIIRLNVAEQKLEQLFIINDTSRKEGTWRFEQSPQTYPFNSKFIQSTNNAIDTLYEDPILISKTINKKDVLSSTGTYFSVPKGYKIELVSAVLNVSEQLDALIKERAGKLFVIVYYSYYDYVRNHNGRGSDVCHVKEKIELIKDKYKKELIFNDIIINEVVIKYPLE